MEHEPSYEDKARALAQEIKYRDQHPPVVSTDVYNLLALYGLSCVIDDIPVVGSGKHMRPVILTDQTIT